MAETGEPKGYVEHIRPITPHSIEVRKAIASGKLKARPRTQRQVLTTEETAKQADAIRTALAVSR